jgi:hypothetical protein
MESPHEHFRRIVADTGDRIAAIRAIRERFGLDLRQAKEVMLQAEGTAASLAEHQERIAQTLEKVVPLAEISYDLVMGDDMPFVEGTYRLPGGPWQVVIVSAFQRDVPEPEVVPQTWESGATGVLVRFPRRLPLNAEAVEQVLSGALGVWKWRRVRGPDSMQVR